MTNIILFSSKTNPGFSNFYIAPFDVAGEIYNSVEHYFMLQKARLFDPNGEAVKKMSNECTPAQMKKLGRQVENFNQDTWDFCCKKIMYEGVLSKFSQNPELKEKLLSTGHMVIAEASPFDKKWGTGIGTSSKDAYDADRWTGRNWLGLILMGVRGDLRYGPIEDYNDFSSEDITYHNYFNMDDWGEFAYRYQLHPAKEDALHWRDICLQATGNLGYL